MSSQKIVRVSNQIIRCVQPLSINEKRLLMLLISKLRVEEPNALVDITASEFSAVYGIAKDGVYSTMKAAEEKLWDRQFFIDGRKRRWVVTCDYIRAEGTIQLQAHDHLTDHIGDLKQHYTQYYLRRAGNFKSLYSWRLFELLMQFRTTGILKITLSEFKELLEVPKSYDRDFAIVRNKVINAALKEIKAAGLPVKLKTEKKGRSIHMLIFTFPCEQQTDWLSANFEAIKARYLGKHAKAGESQQAAEKRLSKELKQLKKEAQAVK